MEQYNEKFAVVAAKTENLHRRLNVQAPRLADILCHREQGHVSEQLSMSYDRKQIILMPSDLTDGLRGQYELGQAARTLSQSLRRAFQPGCKSFE